MLPNRKSLKKTITLNFLDPQSNLKLNNMTHPVLLALVNQTCVMIYSSARVYI